MSMKPFKTGAEAYAALPDTIRVGPFVCTLEKWHQDNANARDQYGEFESFRQVVRIRADMPTPQKAADTLLHEVMHAIFWAYGIQDGDKEERLVSTISSALLGLYRDNLWLGDWLKRCV